MFYQDALPKFWLYPVSIACLQSEIDIGKNYPLHSKQPTQQININFSLRGNWCLFMWGACFCMGAYKCNVVVVIKLGAYIHGASFLWMPIILVIQYPTMKAP